MKLTIDLCTDNDAFHGHPAAEIKRIIARMLDSMSFDEAASGHRDDIVTSLRDSNGNTVGSWSVS